MAAGTELYVAVPCTEQVLSVQAPLSEYRITFNNHETFFTESITNIFLKRDYLDIVFICKEAVNVCAHKAVLASVSVFLHELIKSNKDEIVFVSLPDVYHNQLRLVLDLVYNGVIRANIHEVAELKAVVSLLGVQLNNVEVTSLLNSEHTPSLNSEHASCSGYVETNEHRQNAKTDTDVDVDTCALVSNCDVKISSLSVKNDVPNNLVVPINHIEDEEKPIPEIKTVPTNSNDKSSHISVEETCIEVLEEEEDNAQYAETDNSTQYIVDSDSGSTEPCNGEDAIEQHADSANKEHMDDENTRRSTSGELTEVTGPCFVETEPAVSKCSVPVSAVASSAVPSLPTSSSIPDRKCKFDSSASNETSAETGIPKTKKRRIRNKGAWTRQKYDVGSSPMDYFRLNPLSPPQIDESVPAQALASQPTPVRTQQLSPQEVPLLSSLIASLQPTAVPVDSPQRVQYLISLPDKANPSVKNDYVVNVSKLPKNKVRGVNGPVASTQSEATLNLATPVSQHPDALNEESSETDDDDDDGNACEIIDLTTDTEAKKGNTRGRVFSKEQRNIMEMLYKKQPYPTVPLRKLLSKRFNVSGKVVSDWFSHRRRKDGLSLGASAPVSKTISEQQLSKDLKLPKQYFSEQIEEKLEEAYKKNPVPDLYAFGKLAGETGVPRKLVSMWFTHRLAKDSGMVKDKNDRELEIDEDSMSNHGVDNNSPLSFSDCSEIVDDLKEEEIDIKPDQTGLSPFLVKEEPREATGMVHFENDQGLEVSEDSAFTHGIDNSSLLSSECSDLVFKLKEEEIDIKLDLVGPDPLLVKYEHKEMEASSGQNIRPVPSVGSGDQESLRKYTRRKKPRGCIHQKDVMCHLCQKNHIMAAFAESERKSESFTRKVFNEICEEMDKNVTCLTSPEKTGSASDKISDFSKEQVSTRASCSSENPEKMQEADEARNLAKKILSSFKGKEKREGVREYSVLEREQVVILLKEFEKNRYINRSQADKLAKKLHLTPHRVLTFFAKRRHKLKKQMGDK